jgi:hypothetical protein
MNEKKKGEYFVAFKGCRPLSKRQANQWGLTLICGFFTAGIAALTLGKSILSAILIIAVTVVAIFFAKSGSNKKILLIAKRDLPVIANTSALASWTVRVRQIITGENTEKSHNMA